MATSKVENSAQILSCELKFVHAMMELSMNWRKHLKLHLLLKAGIFVFSTRLNSQTS
jgi:hypothetical protein